MAGRLEIEPFDASNLDAIVSLSLRAWEPVFESIADSVVRLLDAWSAAVFRCGDEKIWMVAARGGLPGSSETWMGELGDQRAQSHDDPHGRAALTRSVQHVTDMETDPSLSSRIREGARMRGFRSALVVPMLRGLDALGVIAVTLLAAALLATELPWLGRLCLAAGGISCCRKTR